MGGLRGAAGRVVCAASPSGRGGKMATARSGTTEEQVLKRLQKELDTYEASVAAGTVPDGILSISKCGREIPQAWKRTSLKKDGTNCRDEFVAHVSAKITGPEDSPYAGGVFTVSLNYPLGYPFVPPLVAFTTKVYHPCVSNTAGFCKDDEGIFWVGFDILQHNWTPIFHVHTLLDRLLDFLKEPLLGHHSEILAPAVGRQYREDRPAYEATAREWTRQFATAAGTRLGGLRPTASHILADVDRRGLPAATVAASRSGRTKRPAESVPNEESASTQRHRLRATASHMAAEASRRAREAM